jgi:nicotinate-nucleotide adenylyltransferase
MIPTFGLLGGTFDPVHFGHLRLAIEIQQALDLDAVKLLPNHLPPHRGTPRASSAQRKEMLSLAISEVAELSIDDRELKRDKASYTIDTLIEFRHHFPNHGIYFLMGMDSLRTLPSWHRWQELLEQAHLVVAHRPGWEPPASGDSARLLEKYQADIQEAKAKRHGHIIMVNTPMLDISSTRIRKLMKQQRSCRFLLPDPVIDFIAAHRLYLDADDSI